MPIDPGTRLGPYLIEAPLGAGGMGEVYRARDTRLDRAVAIKVLTDALAGDPQFRERFDREARAISQLAHPNICTLHDVGEWNGAPYLVMELLDGESLERRLVGGRLPPALALKIAIDVATGLDAAHRVGIVHRDLKPGNIFLVRGATASAPPTAKLLDFGLAKSRGPTMVVGSASMVPTTPPLSITAAGAILGTLQYMAPEQIDGVESDARTDLFALGCVLFEMFTGRKAFAGNTRAALLGGILKDDPPPVSTLAPDAPAALDRLVQSCLAKDPDERWQTARDVLRELKWIAAHPDPTPSAAPAEGAPSAAASTLRTARSLATMAAVAVASATIAAAGVWLFVHPQPPARAVAHLEVQPPDGAPLFLDGVAPDVALSPDGKYLVFTAGTGQSQLYIRALDKRDATLLAGTTGVRGPFFSPDSQWVAYFQQGDLKKVSVAGGTPQTICAGCATGNRGGSWGDDDTIVFTSGGGSSGLQRVPASGGDPVTITKVDATRGETVHNWPELVPGGKSVMFTVFIGGLESASIVAQDLKTGVRTVLVKKGSQAHFVGTDRLAFVNAGTLFVIPFDPARVATFGNPVQVLDHIVLKSVGSADFSVSRDGGLAYASGTGLAGTTRLAWVDRQGHEDPIAAPPRSYIYPRLSPDGSQVALDVRDQQLDIWIWNFAHQQLTRLTTEPAADQNPAWSPDGKRVAFSSNRDGSLNVYWQAVDGTGTAEQLTKSPNVQQPWAFTRDGHAMIIRDETPATGLDLALLPLDGSRAITSLVHSPFNESNAELSPDGRWLAYESNETGRPDVHVRPFPDVNAGHWQVSINGGTRPLWSRDGRELFYVDLKPTLMSVSVPIRPGTTTFEYGGATTVLDLRGVSAVAVPGRYYDVSLDGRKFLFLRNAAAVEANAEPPRLHVVVNWKDEVERLLKR